MNRKGGRLLCTLFVLIAVLSAVSAATITWSWVPNDTEVDYYRYRLDDGDWTTVDSTTTAYIQTDAESTGNYTLYLQQSYDGENWSLESYGTTAPQAPKEAIAEETITPALEVKKDNNIKYSLLFKTGVSERISFNPFSFANGTDFMRINIGTAFDVSNLINAGRHFSFGLRSDLTADIIVAPDIGGWSGINKDNFYKLQTSYDYDTGIDLKFMAQAEWDIARIYLGGGVGYSLFNQASADEALETHTLKLFRLFGAEFDSAWFVSGLAGVSFRITDLFSLGTELSYRYMLPSSAHIFNADLVMGFTF